MQPYPLLLPPAVRRLDIGSTAPQIATVDDAVCRNDNLTNGRTEMTAIDPRIVGIWRLKSTVGRDDAGSVVL